VTTTEEAVEFFAKQIAKHSCVCSQPGDPAVAA
jgi:hypothetical protein